MRFSATKVCTYCGFKGCCCKVRPGSDVMEVALWLCLLLPAFLGYRYSTAILIAFLFPGLLYTVWRSFVVEVRCPACGSDALIPEESPRAVKMVQAGHTFTWPEALSQPTAGQSSTNALIHHWENEQA